jgi:acyl transferase domain-containing protein
LKDEMKEPNAADRATERDEPTGLEVAVIGMACRFPGAGNLDEFWRNLREGVESIDQLNDQELAAIGESPELLALPNYVRVGRNIAGHHLFDAGLFGFSPREAELIDPQQRLFLECAWEALEHAGHDPASFPGLVGVYGGLKFVTYVWHIYADTQLMASVGEITAQIATDRDYMATRVSYKLGLGGPSMTVQTACSTSLVAVHLACQALLGGECQMALAGGVSVRTLQTGYLYHPGEILSPDGHVRAFDAAASGTIFGNGLGIVVLRRLEDALADGDRIYAVIRGSAVNNDSAQRVGFTAPGADGQERVIRAAHTVAEIDPGSITYVEAHGTGTQVGDPIELTAITRAFRAATAQRGFCGIGSVKTNIGHLASAAGVAGLIKTCLALHHREIPPSLLCANPTPQFDWAASPFYVVQQLTPWTANGKPRRAGVSAFGIGGTNAHVVLEEAPPPPPSSPPSRPWQLLVLSARTETALVAATGNLAGHLRANPDLGLADVAFTLQLGRRALEHRRMLLCQDLAEAASALESLDPARVFTRTAESRQAPVAFLFPGQGAQHAGMLAGVHAGEPVFREQLDRCAELLAPRLGLDLRTLLDPPAGEREAAARQLEQTAITQPALFAVEYALARQWMAWGVQPAAMLGHSIGEYVAACLAGVMTLDDAVAVVAARGRLMQELPPGAMASVALPPEEVEPLLGSQLSLATHNAPRRVVVSGPEEAIAALAAELAGRGVDCRRLHTSHAFHSRMMEPVLAPFAAELAKVELGPPRLPYVSNLTGRWVTAAEATDPGYWLRHLLGTVRFSQGLRLLLDEPQRVLLEVGPGQTLTALARQHPGRGGGQAIVASARRVDDERDDHAQLLGALGQVWLAGATVDWRAFHRGEQRRRLTLPAYPFERRPYWLEPPAGVLSRQETARPRGLADWFYVPYWKPGAPRLPLGEGAPAASGSGGGWLLFADELGLGSELAELLARRGERVAVVVPGQRFAAHPGGVFEIAPARSEDYDALFRALTGDDRAAAGEPAAAAGVPAVAAPGEPAVAAPVSGDDRQPAFGVPRHVVHLWTLTAGDRPAALPGLASVEELGFYSLLFLAQALGRQRVSGSVDLAVVSNGLHEVRGGEPLCPEKALVLGPCKVLPQEVSYLSCRSIDVVAPAAGGGRAELAELLAGELAAESREQVLAYRQGRRWVQAFEPVALPAAPAARLPLRERGVYLITGGLGGIGRVLAEHLAVSHRARLVLTGRSALPPRERWPELLSSHPADDAQCERIRGVQRIEELGGEVLVAAADVTDETRMRELVDEVRQTFGEVNGVIHSAGLPGAGIAQTKTRATAAAVLAPKVRGLRVLEAALDGTRLDFLALCSSGIAVFGNFGQIDYCAANCFLDAYAADYAARHGVPAVAIDWNAWSEVGMAVKAVAEELLPARYLAGAEPVAGAAAQPGAGVTAEPGAGVTAEPGAGATAEPGAGAAAEPGAGATAEPEAGATAEPGAGAAANPAPGPVAGSTVGPASAAGPAPAQLHPLLHRQESREPARAVFSTRFSPSSHWLVAEHQVLGTPTLAGTAHIEMARAAWEQLTGETAAELRDVFFLTPMMLGGDEGRETRIVLERQPAGYRFSVASRPDPAAPPGAVAARFGGSGGSDAMSRGGGDAAWVEHAFGEIGSAGGDGSPRRLALDEIRSRCDQTLALAGQAIFGDPDGAIFWGPRWQVTEQIARGPQEGLVTLQVAPEHTGDLDRFGLHPVLLDVAVSMAVSMQVDGSGGGDYLPISYRRVRLARPLPARVHCYVRLQPVAGGQHETLTTDLEMLDERGAVVAEVEGFVTKRVGAAVSRLERAARGGARSSRIPAVAAAAPTAASEAGPPAATAAAPGRAAAAGQPRLPVDGMSNAEGVEVFLRVLAHRPGTQVTISQRDLGVLLEHMARARAHEPEASAGQAGPQRAAHPRPNLPTAFTAPRSELERQLAEIWQEVLAIDAVGVDDNFYELGGDSVMGVQILARARKRGIELTNNQLFEQQTIAAIAAAMGGRAPAAAGAAGTGAEEVAESAAAAPSAAAAAPSAPAAGVAATSPARDGRALLAGVPAEVRDRLLAGGQVEDLYPLSPLQQGLLFHSLAAPQAGVYVEQLHFDMRFAIDLELFTQAWQRSVDLHPALRTSFLWEDVERPLQLVHRRVEVAIDAIDMRDLEPAAREQRLQAWRRADREQPFDLATAPLMRMGLARLADDHYEGLWTHHHLLLDGWSSPMLVREAMTSYKTLLAGGDPQLVPTRPFRDYVEWLERRDAAADEAFWRRTLAGFKRPGGIGADRPASGLPAAAGDFVTREARLAAPATAALQALARQGHVTLNNITQGMWALALGQASGETDVVFGISVSTRPEALGGFEATVGLFINTLPFRAAFGGEADLLPCLQWLQGLQQAQVEMLGHVQASPVEVKRWSEVPAELPLFESVFDFWNFARDEWLEAFVGGQSGYEVATHYPLSLRAIPGANLALQLTFDRRRFDEATAARLLRGLETALAALAEAPEATLQDLQARLEQSERSRRQERAGEIAGLAQEKLRQGLGARGRRRGTPAKPAR